MTQEHEKGWSIRYEDKVDFWNFLQKTETFLFLCPKNADGDTIGTNTALAMYVEQQLGKKAILYAPITFGEKYTFFPWVDRYVTEFDPEEVDGVFISDTGDLKLLAMNDMEKRVFERGVPVVNLDHHISNDGYGDIRLLDTKSSCSAIVLYQLLTTYKARITPDMATLLLVGIYYDTGGLIHPNTDTETLKVTADLVAKGGNADLVHYHVFRKASLGKLQLMGLIFDRAEINEDGILMSAVTTGDLHRLGVTREDLEGIIDYLNAVPNKKFCVLLSEDGKGNVKGSMRTQETDVDLNEIAQTLGGGGHRMAAAFTLKNHKLEPEVRWKIKKKAEVQ